MNEFEGRVAVVTGAASGIGFALAERFAAAGMRVALADVEAPALEAAAKRLAERGADVLAVPTDVSQLDAVQALADRTREAFGAVHVVCNNAGVFTGGKLWEAPAEDFDWLMGVNVYGVIHGIRTFVPILLEQGEGGHVVNTASMAAVTSMPWTGIYFMTKHAVLSLSETLYHELTQLDAGVGVSVVCPELVSTGIDRSDRNRPDTLQLGAAQASDEIRKIVNESIAAGVQTGIPPSRIADRTFDAIRENRFYVLAEDVWRRTCETRLEDIRLGRNPTFAPPIEED
ncbi:MAG: SDR family NAD(P)-dependent oxidoreductase [Myxococcota bacterium]|nr:SDR family NAD(P)-dependent oxidoreductase [Myxococcota bacterium]